MRFKQGTILIGGQSISGLTNINIKITDNLSPAIERVKQSFSVDRWEVSGVIDLPNDKKRYLKKWLKPDRLPRKLKKHIKADIHRFFIPQNRYKISPLINWQKRFNIK